MFLRKSVLKICSKFTGEHPRRSAISIKLLNRTSAWVSGPILDLLCVPRSDAALFCEHYAKHLEKGLNRGDKFFWSPFFQYQTLPSFSRLDPRCSPVNLLHIFRTHFLKDTSGWLLLII